MPFLGLPFGNKAPDKDRFIEMERRYDQAKRERLLKEQEEEKERQANGGKDAKKKTRKERFREGFASAEKKLNTAADKAVVVHKKVNYGLGQLDTGASKFAEAAHAFSINPDTDLYVMKPDSLSPFDFNVTGDDRQYGKRAGPIHGDGLRATFDPNYRTPGARKNATKSDPLYEMFGVGSPSKGKTRRKKVDFVWF